MPFRKAKVESRHKCENIQVRHIHFKIAKVIRIAKTLKHLIAMISIVMVSFRNVKTICYDAIRFLQIDK